MRIRISVATTILLACCLVAPHADGSITARINAAKRSKNPVAKRQPIKVATRPGALNIADWLNAPGADKPGRASRADRSSRRQTQSSAPRQLKASEKQAAQKLEPALNPPGQGSKSEPAGLSKTGPNKNGEPAGEQVEEPAEEPAEEPVTVKPPAPKPAREFSTRMIRLRDRIRVCLVHHYQRPQSVARRSPWGIMHSLIGYGVDADVLVGRRRVNAIGWLCWNRPCRGMQLLYMDGDQLATRHGPGYQGHEGQLLSMLALSRVKKDYPMRVDGHELTIVDLIEHEKLTCKPGSELTFKLIGLSHYVESDATWTSKSGLEWDIPRLIREELAQKVIGACCGGTHRLIGYSMAVKRREKRGEPVDGQWLRAKKMVSAYHKHAMKLQNRDGSFSTSWLEKRDASGNMDRRLQTTGHILEWLVFSLPEDELTDPRIVRSANYLVTLMLNNRNHEWEIGPQGHALRALALYNERVFGDKPGERRALMARRPRK